MSRKLPRAGKACGGCGQRPGFCTCKRKAHSTAPYGSANFLAATRLLIHMAEYLSKAGWERDGDYWLDPECPRKNYQKLNDAVKSQVDRDVNSTNDPSSATADPNA